MSPSYDEHSSYIACPFPFMQSKSESLAPFGKEVNIFLDKGLGCQLNMISKKSTLQWSLLSISINFILSVFGWMMVVQALKHLRQYITYKVCIKVLIRQFVAKYWVRVSFSMSKGLIVWFGEVIFQKFEFWRVCKILIPLETVAPVVVDILI